MLVRQNSLSKTALQRKPDLGICFEFGSVFLHMIFGKVNCTFILGKNHQNFYSASKIIQNPFRNQQKLRIFTLIYNPRNLEFFVHCLLFLLHWLNFYDILSTITPQSRQSAKPFLQSSELELPQSPTRRRVCPPPFGSGGGTHSLAGEGLGEPQFWRGDTHCGTLYIYVVCELPSSPSLIENTHRAQIPSPPPLYV